jgi:hypothetical protein
MPRLQRLAILAKLQAMKKARRPIIGGGARTGLSAKCEEAGGIDLIVIYNSGRYRMAGRGSLAGVLAYANANEIVRDMTREVLPVVKHTPVLAGVNGTHPFCLFDPLLDDLKRLGFSGVQNFPTVGLIDGIMRANLEETGTSYALEVEMIALARVKDHADDPFRLFSRGRAGDGEGRRRRDRLPSWPDGRRNNRRAYGAEAKRMPETRGPVGRRGSRCEPVGDHPRPRRSGHRASGRRIHPAIDRTLPWL